MFHRLGPLWSRNSRKTGTGFLFYFSPLRCGRTHATRNTAASHVIAGARRRRRRRRRRHLPPLSGGAVAVPLCVTSFLRALCRMMRQPQCSSKSPPNVHLSHPSKLSIELSQRNSPPPPPPTRPFHFKSPSLISKCHFEVDVAAAIVAAGAFICRREQRQRWRAACLSIADTRVQRRFSRRPRRRRSFFCTRRPPRKRRGGSFAKRAKWSICTFAL